MKTPATPAPETCPAILEHNPGQICSLCGFGRTPTPAPADAVERLRKLLKGTWYPAQSWREIATVARDAVLEEAAQVVAELDPDAMICIGGHDLCGYGPCEGCPYCENRSPIAAALRARKGRT